jgi:hypothetical protein
MKPTENKKRKKERKNKEKKNKALLNPLTKVSQISIPTHSFLTKIICTYATILWDQNNLKPSTTQWVTDDKKFIDGGNMIYVFQLHNLSCHNLQINYANIMSRSMLSIPHQHK